MTSTFKRNENKMSRALIMVIVLAIGFVLYLGFFSQPSAPVDTEVIKKEKVPQISENLLNEEVLGEFHSWDVIPVEAGETGKSNPFSR